MKLDLKISQKGLIIVAVPLLLEFILLLSLAALLHQAEVEIQQEAHSREVVMHANILLRRLISASTNLAAYSLNRNYSFAFSSKRHIEQVHFEINKLRELLKDQPVQLARMDNTAVDVERLFEVLKSIEGVSHEPRGIASFLHSKQFFNEMHDILDQVSKRDIDPLLVWEEKALAERPAARARNRQEIQAVIAGGLIINVFLAFYLTQLFSKGITARLQYLTDNTVRLAKKMPLAPRLQGSDEIANLDGVFHEMADALEEAAKKEKEIQELRQAFVAMVSHDLRTPLTSVMTFLNMLTRGRYGDLPEKTMEKAEVQERNIERLIALINDLLDLEKIESGVIHLNPAPTSMRRVVEHSLSAIKPVAEENKVSIAEEGDDREITADADRLVQVVTNLLSNALKYSPSGGTVTVGITADADWVELRVKDEGPGIQPQHKEIIFERFQQVKSADGIKRSGTGLGLAICKTIVEQHGGTIGVDSEEGKGSEFWFRLPKSESGESIGS